MRPLIAAFLIIICIPALVMSEEFKIHKFEPNTLIEAKKFNENFDVIVNGIYALEKSIKEELNANNKAIESEISDLNKLKTKFEAMGNSLNNLITSRPNYEEFQTALSDLDKLTTKFKATQSNIDALKESIKELEKAQSLDSLRSEFNSKIKELDKHYNAKIEALTALIKSESTVKYGDRIALQMPEHGNIKLSGGERTGVRTSATWIKRDEIWQIVPATGQ